MNDQGRSNTLKPKIVLVVIFLLFLIPIILAYTLFRENVHFSTVNRGNLIQPVFSINQLQLSNSSGQILNNAPSNKAQPASDTRTNGKWLLMMLYPGNCDEACTHGLYNMRQIRTASGKNMDRVERAIVTYQPHGADQILSQIIGQQYPGTMHLIANQKQFSQIIDEHVKKPYALHKGTLYVIDPRGFIMMSYKPGTAPTKVYKDLQRLLKVSQIG